mmetsp:Transcript_67709/g.192135  ORF Transcript_67709/g.192135 Transcript_67709/m.192135 type:complete len:226 (-) Transcript_67709:2412-3089(-)
MGRRDLLRHIHVRDGAQAALPGPLLGQGRLPAQRLELAGWHGGLGLGGVLPGGQFGPCEDAAHPARPEAAARHLAQREPEGRRADHLRVPAGPLHPGDRGLPFPSHLRAVRHVSPARKAVRLHARGRRGRAVEGHRRRLRHAPVPRVPRHRGSLSARGPRRRVPVTEFVGDGRPRLPQRHRRLCARRRPPDAGLGPRERRHAHLRGAVRPLPRGRHAVGAGGALP